MMFNIVFIVYVYSFCCLSLRIALLNEAATVRGSVQGPSARRTRSGAHIDMKRSILTVLLLVGGLGLSAAHLEGSIPAMAPAHVHRRQLRVLPFLGKGDNMPSLPQISLGKGQYMPPATMPAQTMVQQETIEYEQVSPQRHPHPRMRA